MMSYGILHHALQALKLGYEILFLAFFGLAVAVTLAVVAPLALPGRKTLFLAIDLPSLAVNREAHDRTNRGCPSCHRTVSRLMIRHNEKTPGRP